jgi:nucleoside-diphosphate-sugar epimerase
MAKLVVTGGCGFLGFHVCKKFAKKYSKILVIDIDDFRKEEYPKNVMYLRQDVRDFEGLKKAFKGYDAVVNAAAALPLWKPKDIYTTNIDGMKNVLEAAKINKIKRVVQISSTAVYGVPDHHPLYETDELIGVGPYGITKIEAEIICGEYRKKGMIVPVIRPKTFIGTERLGVFQILYDWAEAGALIPCIGNGENRYQLLEVTDLVDAIALCLKKPAKIVNDTFNVGAKNTKPIGVYLQEFFTRVKSKSRVMKTWASPLIFLLELFWMLRISPLYKWVYGTAHKDSFVSIEKAEKKLGWKPKFTEADALVHSYQWYKKNEDKVKGASGVTHRVAWKQGIVGAFKGIMVALNGNKK